MMFNRLLRNFLSGIGVRVFNIAATFIATPLLLLHLGDAGYGFFVLLLGIIGFGGLLDLGLTQSLVRSMASTPEDQRQTLYATAAWLFIVLGLIGAALIWFGKGVLLHYVVIMPEGYQANMTVAMAWLAVSLPFKMITTFAGAILHATEDIHEANIAQTGGTFVRFALSASLAAVGQPLENVVIAFPASFIFTLLVQIIYLRRHRWLHLCQLSCAQRAHLKPLSADASGIFLAQASGELALHADKFIISSVLGVSALAPYNVAYLIAARVSDIGSLIASVSFPRLVRHLSTGDQHEMWKLYRQAMLWTLMIGISGVSAILIFDQWFLNLWIGKERATAVLPLMWPFLAGVLVGLPSWLNGNMLITFSQSQQVALSVGIGAMISITLCFLGTQHMGVMGAAWAWTIGYAVIAIAQICMLRRYRVANEYRK